MTIPCRNKKHNPRRRGQDAALACVAAAVAGTLAPVSAAQNTIDGVEFLSSTGALYAPAAELSAALGLPLRTESPGRLLLGDWEIAREHRRRHPDGSTLLHVRSLAELAGANIVVTWEAEKNAARVSGRGVELLVLRGSRSVTDGLTFADEPDLLHVPLSELRRALAPASELPADETAWGLSAGDRRYLSSGEPAVPVTKLEEVIRITWPARSNAAHLTYGDRELWVRHGGKRVALNLQEQRMRAWEGDRLVLDTRISSGRPGMETPRGSFRAGPLKSPLVISRKYGNARMPWSVQVRGNVFIHGFPSVPPHAASHGCVRVPLTGRNPARWFYEWVTIGTPMEISHGWPVDFGAE